MGEAMRPSQVRALRRLLRRDKASREGARRFLAVQELMQQYAALTPKKPWILPATAIEGLGGWEGP